MRRSGNCTCPSSAHGRWCSRAQSCISSTWRFGRPITVVLVAIPLLKELLVLGLQLVLRDHAMDVRACLMQAFGLLQIGAIDLRVVLQLPRPLDTVVERLSVMRASLMAARLQQVATLFGQRDDRRVAIEPDGFNQP